MDLLIKLEALSKEKMTLSIGNDHRGCKLKKIILDYLNKENIEYKDFGSDSEESSDYPDYGFKVARSVSDGETDFGILVCSNGIGMSIVANKVKGIRAALCITPELAKAARAHNNANVLVLSGENTNTETTLKIIDEWISTKFEKGGRHERRVNKIHQLTRM